MADAPGILPVQRLRGLADERAIRGKRELDDDQFQPASLDLRLGPRIHRLRASFLPSPGRTIKEELEALYAGVKGWELYRLDLDESGRVLEPGQVYLIELEEELDLPEGVSAVANPKSSTGRLDIFTRLVVDGGGGFDRVPPGYSGKLYLEVFSRTFAVRVHRGTSLNQLRFIGGELDPVDPESTDLEYLRHPEGDLFDGDRRSPEGALELTVGLDPAGDPSRDGVVGYRARRHAPLLDLSERNTYSVDEYWEPLTASRERGALVLEPEEFYLLSSRERVVIPPGLAAEMSPYEARIGELRTHYAGFFDPGFGWLPDRSVKGTHAVLEVRAHDVPFLIYDGLPICTLKLYPMSAEPESHYGEDIGSHYARQRLALSKHFQM